MFLDYSGVLWLLKGKTSGKTRRERAKMNTATALLRKHRVEFKITIKDTCSSNVPVVGQESFVLLLLPLLLDPFPDTTEPKAAT